MAQCQAEDSHEAVKIQIADPTDRIDRTLSTIEGSRKWRDILKGEDPIGGSPFTFFFFDSLIHLLIKVFGSTCHQRDDGMIWRERDTQDDDDDDVQKV